MSSSISNEKEETSVSKPVQTAQVTNINASSQPLKTKKPVVGNFQVSAKAKTAEVKWSTEHQNNVEFSNPSSEWLKESFLWVVIGSGKSSVQMTIHRPIGVTKCHETAWVKSPTTEINALIASAKDPSEAKLNQNRSQFKTFWLVKSGLLVRKDNQICYPIEVDKNQPMRGSVLDEAKQKFALYKKDVRMKIQSQHPDWPVDKINSQPIKGDLEDFLPEIFRLHEMKIDKELKFHSVKEQAEHAFPQEYQTRYMNGDPQIPFCYAANAQQVKDKLYRSMMDFHDRYDAPDKEDIDFSSVAKEIDYLKKEIIGSKTVKSIKGMNWADVEVESDKTDKASKGT